MATIGRSSAVAQIGRLEFSGWPAWAAWLLVHLIFLIGFRNRAAVLLQWTYSYFTYKLGSRIITGLDGSSETSAAPAGGDDDEPGLDRPVAAPGQLEQRVQPVAKGKKCKK